MIVIFPLGIQGQESSGKESGETLINRRVLILDFLNTKNSQEYAYLEDSIPDALMEPLNRTKSFELMLRSTWKNFLIQKKFTKEDSYKEETAIEAGKLAEADVIVIGQFIAFEDSIELFAKAIEMSSGRVIVSTSSRALLDNNLFKAIKALADTMAGEMKSKLPPIPQTVIVNERIKYITKGGPMTSAERKKQSEIELKASKWQIQQQIEAQKWREQEQVQAAKWRAQEARRGWKENEAMMATIYWEQPAGFRLFGNLMIGILSGAAMGTGVGFGFSDLTALSMPITLGIFGSSGSMLGLISGIIVTIYDNNHINHSIMGDKLLLNSWSWYTLGSLVGAGVATGISYITYNDFHSETVRLGLAIGSLTGFGIGLVFTIIPLATEGAVKKVAGNLILSTQPDQTLIGYRYKF